MTQRLSEAESLVLSIAAARAPDAVPSEDLAKTPTCRLALGRLVKRGLLAREEGQRQQAPDLVGPGVKARYSITTTGLRAIGVEMTGDPQDGLPTETSIAFETRTAERPAPRGKDKKIDRVIALVNRREGAGLAELAETTGWQPHTIRSALTGLRQKGVPIERVRDQSGRSVYVIGTPTSAEVMV